MDNKLVVSFAGPLPSRGEVAAYTCFESMLAFSQAATMILHFSQTGDIRRRKFAELGVDLRLTATREGSFEFLLDYQDHAKYLASFIGGAVTSGITWDVIKGSLNRVIGVSSSDTLEKLEKNPDFKSGDLGALIQALEPAVRRIHTSIGNGANKISIKIDGKKDIVVFDKSTKDYLLSNIVNERTRAVRFLVTSFDGRNRTGRVFHLDHEQAYTFELSKDADRRSLTTIVDAHSSYCLRTSGTKLSELQEAVCTFTSIDSVDGRMKKLIFHKVRKSFDPN